MPVNIHIEIKDGYLHAKATGENTLENVRSYLEQVTLACMARKCVSVLIEENLTGPSLGVHEVHQIASGKDSSTLPPPTVRIAYIDTNPEHIHARMDFAASVANFHGMKVQVFRTVAEAEAWLRLPQ